MPQPVTLCQTLCEVMDTSPQLSLPQRFLFDLQ